MSDWTDAIVGDRMTVDQEFAGRVASSQFSTQEWGLIMTATELDIEHADDPDRARIVADTSKVEGIMPELESLDQGMPMGGGGGGGGRSNGSGVGGLVGSLKTALGLADDGVDDGRLAAAERLTREYAAELQSHLESRGKWEQVRLAYQE